MNLEDTCLRWKDVSSVRMPALPDSAGAFRAWKNAFLPLLIALDSSDQSHLYTWLLEAFNARTPQQTTHLQEDSDGFPRFDRILCSWFTKDACLKGYFGTRIQAFIEESIARGMQLRGRPLLNLVVREFDLDAALGGVVSAVELFQISSPDSDMQSLIHFRDKVRYILGQLPIGDRPADHMMSKWLYERLKKVRQLQLTVDRIRESPAGSNERTYDYLWNRLERVIAESQQEKNLSSVQEGLKKGPKKLATPGNPSNASNGQSQKGKKGKGKNDGKSKGQGKGGKNQGKFKSSTTSTGGFNDGKGSGGNPKPDQHTTQNSNKKDSVCLFYPKGLCRRGADCPYRHEGPPPALSTSGALSSQAKAKATPAKAPPAAKAAVALIAATQVLGASASIASSPGPIELEWALDSGAGENLASVGAFVNQGVPTHLIEQVSTVSSSPITFETGGGAKSSTNTVGTIGDVTGDGLVYLLKACPYVRSLGKLIEKGFSFFWGPEYDPTLVPPNIPFRVSCDTSCCHIADRVEHCVPIFRETTSFTYGMPAVGVSSDEPSLPALDADAPAVVVEDVSGDSIGLEEMFQELEAMKDDDASKAPHEAQSSDPKGPSVPAKDVYQHNVDEDEHQVLHSHAKLPMDHLLTHQPASKFCDVCRQAKLRARAHQRFANQSEATRDARVIESPNDFLQKISVDHLESTEESLKGDQYALVCVDQYSGVLNAYPARSKSQGAVEQALLHFCREKKPIVASDRYPSILAAVRDLKMSSDPSPPNDPIHNSLVESSINVIRQGTRSLLLQSGLKIEHWPSAMRCFSYQYDLTTPPSDHPGSLRDESHRYHHALPEGVEGPEVPPLSFDNKLHMALSYHPEPRVIPYGSLVWYLGKSKEPQAPKSFGPNGRPAIYVGPEVLPGMRCKDIHVLLDLAALTSTDHVREIRTKDFVSPTGSWVFPLSQVPMLLSPHFKPAIHSSGPPAISPPESSDDLLADISRNRSITKRRLAQYGITDHCDGCINGTYSHTPACRTRFNTLLDTAEPRAVDSGGGQILRLTCMMNQKNLNLQRILFLFLTL